jgi:hypothetical protein
MTLTLKNAPKRIPFSSKPAQVFSNDRADYEHGQLEDAEDEAILRRSGTLLLGFVRVERGLARKLLNFLGRDLAVTTSLHLIKRLKNIKRAM